MFMTVGLEISELSSVFVCLNPSVPAHLLLNVLFLWPPRSRRVSRVGLMFML